jgi:hypothetical protein
MCGAHSKFSLDDECSFWRGRGNRTAMGSAKINKQIVKFAFQNAAETCVRLLSFGRQIGNFGTDEGGYFENVAEELAHSDLITSAISIRRIAEIEEFNKIVRNHYVKKVGPIQLTPTKWEMRNSGETIPLWDLLSTLIHSNSFEIIADDFKIKLMSKQWGNEIWQLVREAKYKTQFRPAMMISSRHVPILMCEILDYAFVCTTFLDQVSNALSEHDIFIGNSNMDV